MSKIKNYYTVIDELTMEWQESNRVLFAEFELEQSSKDEALLQQLPASIRRFYEETNGFRLEWADANHPENGASVGKVDILAPDKVLGDWSDVLWFEDTPKKAPIREFRVLDYISDELFTGFFLGKDQLYLYSISDDPQPMHLDMEGYIQLMLQCYGFRFWQRSVISEIEGREMPETATMKKLLPKVFPAFKYEEFQKLYQSVKLQ
ncbi:hypothetical protein ACWKWU_22315 [Chitinophaga lutea]